jgi:ABC-type nitrate/sulfonate/bicarbonate transport system substrate-binding protein
LDYGPRRRRVWARAVVLTTSAVIASLAFGYAGSRSFFMSRAPPAEKLRIALPTAPHAGLLYIAAARGFFAEEGLEVTLTPVSYGKLGLDLLAQGKVDLTSTSEVPFVISVLQGAPLGVAAMVVSVSNEMSVVARRDRDIAVPRDLIGKRVGITAGTSGDYCLWLFLIRHKIDPASVTLVDLPPGQLAQELARGTIDAVSTWEPIKSEAQVALAGNAVSFTEADAYTITHVVIGESAFLKSRPAVVERLVRALVKAEDFNRSDPQRAMRLVAQELKLPAQTLESGWKDFVFKVDLRQSLLVTLEDESRWAMARGYAAKNPIPNFLPHLYLDALLTVRPEFVTVVR